MADAAMTAYVECAFRWGQDAFWVPILPAGIYVKDLARAIKARLDCLTSEIFIAHPVTARPYPGKRWVRPYEPVRVWVVPLGQVPNVGVGAEEGADGGVDDADVDMCSSTAGGAKCSLEDNAADPADPAAADPAAMPFHAVRVGRKPGIYLSKSEVNPQIIDYAGAEYKAFASFAEADAYLRGSEATAAAAVGERELMSAGSRAKHPPSKSTSPALVDAAAASPSATASAVASAPALGIIDAVFHCLADAETKTAYCVAVLYPASSRAAALTRKFIIEDATSPARAELTSMLLVLQACVDLPGCSARTLIRTYCASTYATNAANDYAVNKTAFSGANGAVMAALAALLKTAKVRAFWTAQTDAVLAPIIRQAVALRLKGA